MIDNHDLIVIKYYKIMFILLNVSFLLTQIQITSIKYINKLITLSEVISVLLNSLL